MALYGYVNIENEIKAAAELYFASYLTGDDVVGNDINTVVSAMLQNDSEYGIVLEFVEAIKKKPESYKVTSWEYRINVLIIYRYNKQTGESQLRSIIDYAQSFLENNIRLNNHVKMAELLRIGTPEPYLIGEAAFYWVPLTVVVWDSSN